MVAPPQATLVPRVMWAKGAPGPPPRYAGWATRVTRMSGPSAPETRSTRRSVVAATRLRALAARGGLATVDRRRHTRLAGGRSLARLA